MRPSEKAAIFFRIRIPVPFHLATSPLWGWLDSNQHLLVGPYRPGAIQSRSPESNRDVQRASARARNDIRLSESSETKKDAEARPGRLFDAERSTISARESHLPPWKGVAIFVDGGHW